MRTTPNHKERTMAIQIINQSQAGSRVYFELTTGKQSALISYSRESGSVRVICQNAAHRVWRGMGTAFDGFANAKAAYKSSGMRAMIEYVESQVTLA